MNVTAKDQVHPHITESTGQVGGTGKWSARVLAGCRDKVVMNDKKTESIPFPGLESLTSEIDLTVVNTPVDDGTEGGSRIQRDDDGPVHRSNRI
tara:strand:+ start:20785 stop:21066 length:282 start_codon:yes stop_codon:yes gene_type:complete